MGLLTFQPPKMISGKYHYRRNLPHIEKSDRSHFITFVTNNRWSLPPQARDVVLAHCIREHDHRIQLHICTVMPDHLHMIFTSITQRRRRDLHIRRGSEFD